MRIILEGRLASRGVRCLLERPLDVVQTTDGLACKFGEGSGREVKRAGGTARAAVDDFDCYGFALVWRTQCERSDVKVRNTIKTYN